MKTILVATDFTSAAHNACVYAASLAREFNARLVVFNAYEHIPFPSSELPLEYKGEDMKPPTKLRLAMAVKTLQVSHSDVPMETLCKEGTVINEIIIAAKEIKADIIVAGMKARCKGFRRIFGSTVTALIAKSALPVIVVPEGIDFASLNTIALANDHDVSSEADPHLLDMLLELGRQFSTKLYLVRIARNRFHESYEVFNRPFRLIKMTRSLEPVYECFEGLDPEMALNEFVVGHKVDMLVLLPHYHTRAERLFSRSTTRAMVFDSQVPLLILPGLRMEEQILK